MTDICRQAVDLLLASMFKTGDGLRSSFIVQQPGKPITFSGFGVDVVFRRKELIRAAIFVRREGPAYLRYLSVEDISSMLRDFVTDSYWCLLDETFFNKFDTSYAEHLSKSKKVALTKLFTASTIFHPTDELTAFPLVPVRIDEPFDAGPFALLPPESLLEVVPAEIPLTEILPTQFPPLKRWTGRTETPQSWLAVRSPQLQVSRKLKAAILGSIALTPLSQYRYLFSGRQMFAGDALWPAGVLCRSEMRTPQR